MSNDQNTSSGEEMKRLPDRPKKPFVSNLLILIALFSGAMLGFAMPNLIGDESWSGLAKAFLIAGAATTVAYGVNRLAIEKGAPLTAINFAGAGVTSVASILIVGGGLFASTFSGLTIGSVSELRLQEYGTELSRFVNYRNQIATKAGQVGPAIQAIAGDLRLKARCEIRSSCVSGRGNGGRGTVSHVLEDKSARAAGIKDQFTAGETKRDAALKRANQLLGEYHKVLGGDGKTISEKRIALQKVDAEIAQATSALDEALPISLLSAYAGELKAGVTIRNRPASSQRLNAILNSHGNSLSDVLDSIEHGNQVRPTFPGKTGVADTFNYIGHFAPIAAITAVVELVFPLTLWIYTFFTLYWRIYQDNPPAPKNEEDDDDGFGGLIDIASSKKDGKIARFPNRKPHHRTASKNRKRGE